MDPPEEDLELSSLIEETIGDRNDDENCQWPAARGGNGVGPSRQQRHHHARSAPPHRQQRRWQQPQKKQNRHPKSRNGQQSSQPKDFQEVGFNYKKALLVLNLAGIVLLLTFVASRTETAIETELVTKTVEVHRNMNSSSASALESSGGGYMGFHDASPENIYGPNRYYKPKGAGYSYHPRGGNHPLYVLEGEIITGNNTEYFDDDYELSPYADLRLKLSDAERVAEDKEWKAKLQSIRDEYGHWDFKDDYKMNHDGKDRPVVDWAKFIEKDGEIDKSDFPQDSWQTDDVYVSNFLSESKKLVTRVLKAIYDEYGWESGSQKGGIKIPDAPTEEGKNGGKGIAYMDQTSFDGLVKRLLRAMMTNDYFFVTLGGHSAAAGHGNNFHEAYMMEFQRVMEPVFDRLGMVLVSANRAQGGMGTIQSALAGSGFYGPVDFMLWDSSMTEKDQKAQDLFWRQALLSGAGKVTSAAGGGSSGVNGRHMPVLFELGGGQANMERIRNEVGAHVGGALGGAILPKFNHTTIDFNRQKYNAACWTDRVDVKAEAQNDKFGGQASWHPGNWVHQSTARKISLVLLHAMDAALTLWERKTKYGGNPLDGKHWHFRAEEDAVREKLMTANASETGCGQLMSSLPQVCTTLMRGAAEWGPRHDPDRSSIRSLLKAAPNGYLPEVIGLEEQLYQGKDPHMPSQRVPKGEVDVATIARSLPPRSNREKRKLVSPRNSQDNHHSTIQDDRHNESRNLEGDEGKEVKIIPGEGWTIMNSPAGYCDGTLNHQCHREKSSNCLMSGHNDNRGMVFGDGLSGWLVLQLKEITEGFALARMEYWHNYNSNPRTDGWTEVNNGGKDDGRIRRRKLKKPPPPLPDTFRFDVAVNGVITSSWNKTEYTTQNCFSPSYNNAFCVLWSDEQWKAQGKKEDIELAIRIRGEAGRIGVVGLSHFYYA